MDIFKILDIEKTKDKMAIKQAYLSKLSETNPEDKPEEFMMLREAYEKALEYADMDEDIEDNYEEDNIFEHENEDINIWLKKVDEVYSDFKTRNDENAWKELLKDDVCQNIDTKNDAREMLLVYFMKNYYLPSNIIRLLNGFFNFIDDLNELYEDFPSEFIDNIIVDGIKYNEYPSYSLFEIDEELDYDGFLRDFYKMNGYYRDGKLDEAIELVENLKLSEVKHPELDRKEAFIYYNMGELDKAWEVISEVQNKYNHHMDLDLLKGMILIEKKDYENAKPYYEEALNEDPENFVAVEGLCRIYENEGKLIEARDLITNLHLNGYKDDDTEELFTDLDKKIIEEFEQKSNIEDLDKLYLLQIADTYFMEENNQKSMEIMELIELDNEIDVFYYYMLSKIYLDMKKCDKSLEYLNLWEDAIKNSSKEKLQKINHRCTSMHELYICKSIFDWERKDSSSALQNIDKALEIKQKSISALTTKLRILFLNERYEDVVKLSDKIIDICPRYRISYMSKIESLYKLGLYSESFNACDQMLEIGSYYLFAYIYKINILIEVDEIDDAKDLIQFLRDEEVECADLDYFEASIIRKEGDVEEAKKLYKDLIDKLENKECEIEFPQDLYLYYIEMIFYTNDEDEILELCEKGLKYDEKNQGLLYYKALALYYKDELDDAKDIYEYLDEIYPDNSYSNQKLGDIYREKGNYDKALEYYNKQIDLNYDITDYFRRIEVNFDMFNMDDVYEDLIYLERNLPNHPGVYIDFGHYYNILDQPEKSCEYLLKAKEIYEESDEYEEPNQLSYDLATVYGKLGKIEKSIEYFMENYKKTDDIDALEQVYNKYVSSGQFEMAKGILQEIIKEEGLSNLSFDYFKRMGDINWEMRNIKEAVKYYSLIIKPDTDQKREKARLLYYTGNSKKALKLITDVINELEYRQDNRYNYLIAAKICLDINQIEKAKDYANKILKYMPISSIESKLDQKAYGYKFIGEVYTILGEYEKAENYLKQALDTPRCAICYDVTCIDALYGLAYLEYCRGNIEACRNYLQETLKYNCSDKDAIGLAYKIGIL
ncbi:MAG: tetratricopeptide repeat protein [Intestinibacter sp.]|uniref:tetratricopeptide repeat protein n=1 Tax=Intestinibacter sp. TaxID=1965304 RepID=UPI003F151D51